MTNDPHPAGVVAVIPARGNSKAILHKNITQLGRWPLVAWTIKAALEAEYIDRIIVSTEDSEIAEVVREYNIEVMARPQNLSEDAIPATQVVKHVLEELKDPAGSYPHIVTMLLPTSPFRTAGQIDNSILAVRDSAAKSVIGVCENAPLISLRYIREMRLEPVVRGEGEGSLNLNGLQSKEQEMIWAVNGAIFTAWSEDFLWEKGFHIKGAVALPMDPISSIEINSQGDLELARRVVSSV